MANETRVAARGVLLSPEDRILLVEMDLPWLGRIWMVPGGGQEAGESLEQTAARELAEETGLHGATIGPRLYWRTVTIEGESHTHDLLEHYFLVHTEEFTPSDLDLTAEETGWVKGHRWWGADEIRRSDALFAPPQIGELLAELVAKGPRPARRIGTAAHYAQKAEQR
jgi:ADP-ribose pyrophosphatase YjhB (NUDIX family)